MGSLSSLFLPFALTLQAALSATIALLVDVIVIAVIKRRVSKAPVSKRADVKRLAMRTGALIWLVLVAAVLLWAITAVQFMGHLKYVTIQL
ncbi:hypothetical protein DFH11DRAFT_1724380 [Phellopilus nigrolimitatus]|nr:hypothetical protein DFH11DRAFT_1724380 [Phellopilus nigrolimitatus]